MMILAAALTALLQAGSWNGTGKVAVSETDGRLEFSFPGVREDGIQRVLLRNPVSVPNGKSLVYDLVSSQISPTMFCALVRDADGREFQIAQKSLSMIDSGEKPSFGSNHLGGLFRFSGLDELGLAHVQVPAMAEPKRETFLAADGRPGKPKQPLEFLGFTLHAESKERRPGEATTEYWLSDFAFATLDPVQDKFFAMFKGQMVHGAAGERPELYVGDVLPHPGGLRHELEWELRDRYDGEPVRHGRLELSFAADDPRPYKLRFCKAAEIPRMPEGTYWVKATARSARDETNGTWGLERTVEFRYDVVRNADGPPASLRRLPRVSLPEATPFTPPAGVSSWRDISYGDAPLVLFSPMVQNKSRWRKAYAYLFDEMARSGDARAAEIQNRWADCEPMPGKYDFSWLTGPLDEAQKRGMRCFVTFAPMDVPEWMPSLFTKNDRGEIYGHSAYLFHGGRINLFHSRYVRDKSLAYLAAMVLAVRDHPACLGYFYITEHSGEAPWVEWYEGFDDDTIDNFREHARLRYGTIDAANAAWNTNFTDFGGVRPPTHDSDCPLPFRRDWLVFRRIAVHQYIETCVETIRRYDRHRIVMCYGDGILYSRAANLAHHGVITANGGCDVPETVFARALAAEAGLPQRAEEISCSNWKARGETQVDISVFAMLGGGGANTHFKMFTPEFATFESLRTGMHGLDRFELFLPILRELRAARPQPYEARAWSPFEGPLAASRCVNGGDKVLSGWPALFALDSQIMFGQTAATNDWSTAKFIWAPPGLDTVSRREADGLLGYVKGGGTVLMCADTGRRIVEDETRDWGLLAEFGFQPPLETRPAKTRIAGLGGAEAGIANEFVPAYGCGETLMTAEDGSPALTSRPFGKGLVYVLWASELVPYYEAGIPDARPFLPELLARAGVQCRLSTQSRLDWGYLLRKDDSTWYLLATCSPMAHSRLQPDGVPKGDRWFRVRLPDGVWKMHDLVSGEDRPAISSSDLAERGFKDALSYRQVRIWRMTRREER